VKTIRKDCFGVEMDKTEIPIAKKNQFDLLIEDVR
jgi:hypothetical protein